MFKILAVVALAAVVLAQEGPTSDEMKSKLVAAGLSDTAASGIVAIGEKYKTQFEAAKEDHEAGKKIFEEVKNETDAYIKTQSEADQAAYAKFLEDVKAKIEAHKAAAGSA